MKKAIRVLGSYLVVGVIFLGITQFFPENSVLWQWCRFLGIASAGIPCAIAVGFFFILPHELAHIWVGKKYGFGFSMLQIPGFKWTNYSGRKNLSFDLQFFPPVRHVLYKKNPTIQEIRLVTAAGPVANLILALLFAPLLAVHLLQQTAAVIVLGHLLYALGSFIGSNSSDRVDGSILRETFKNPEKVVKRVRDHYDAIAEWERPASYDLDSHKFNGDEENDCNYFINWYWKLMDQGKIQQAGRYLREGLAEVQKNMPTNWAAIEICYESAVFFRRFEHDENLAKIADDLGQTLAPLHEKTKLVEGAKRWSEGEREEAIVIWGEYDSDYQKSAKSPGYLVHGRDWFLRLKTEGIVFETNRLLMRLRTIEDVDQVLAIYRNPEVSKYIDPNSKPPGTHEEMKVLLEQWIENQNKRKPGHGAWAIVRKEDEVMVGTILCKPIPGADGEPREEIEIGWHLGPQFWSNGYATEAGEAVIEYGFDQLPEIVRLIALIHPENEASKKVAKRLGMTYIGQSDEFYSQTLDVFEIRRPTN